MVDIDSLTISELVDLEQQVFKRIQAKCIEAGLFMAEQRFGQPGVGNELYAEFTNYYNDEDFEIEIGVRAINEVHYIANEFVTISREGICGDYKTWYLNVLEEERIKKEKQEREAFEYFKQDRYKQYLKLKEEFENE